MMKLLRRVFKINAGDEDGSEQKKKEDKTMSDKRKGIKMNLITESVTTSLQVNTKRGVD